MNIYDYMNTRKGWEQPFFCREKLEPAQCAISFFDTLGKDMFDTNMPFCSVQTPWCFVITGFMFHIRNNALTRLAQDIEHGQVELYVGSLTRFRMAPFSLFMNREYNLEQGIILPPQQNLRLRITWKNAPHRLGRMGDEPIDVWGIMNGKLFEPGELGEYDGS